jgi:hypothetical protein
MSDGILHEQVNDKDTAILNSSVSCLVGMIDILFVISKKFVMVYSLCRRGFIMTFPIRLILYIGYIAPFICPSNPLPVLFKRIARIFVVLFHIGI